MTTLQLTIDGMHCGACVRRVESALRSLPGVVVDRVAVGAATVRLEPGVGAAEAVRVLSENGYSAREGTTDGRD